MTKPTRTLVLKLRLDNLPPRSDDPDGGPTVLGGSGVVLILKDFIANKDRWVEAVEGVYDDDHGNEVSYVGPVTNLTHRGDKNVVLVSAEIVADEPDRLFSESEEVHTQKFGENLEGGDHVVAV